MAVTVGWKEYRRQVQARGYARAAPTRVPNGANLSRQLGMPVRTNKRDPAFAHRHPRPRLYQ